MVLGILLMASPLVFGNEPPLFEKMEELTPTTSPSALTSGPPELPGLLAASVWIMSRYSPSWLSLGRMLRPVALTTPTVTVGSALPSRKA